MTTLPKPGNKLQNKRSGRIVTVLEFFPTLSEKTNWQTRTCYRCFAKGKYIYLLETELDKWSIQ